MAFNCGSGSTTVIGNVDTVIENAVCEGDSTTAPNNTARTDTYTVPALKKWIIRTAAASRDNAGIVSVTADISGTEYYLQISSSATYHSFANVKDLVLAAGDSLKFVFATGVSGFLGSYLTYQELDA